MEPSERIRAIYDDEWRRLRAFATLITGDLSSGEDLAQSVFEVALRQEHEHPGYLRSPAWPWLRPPRYSGPGARPDCHGHGRHRCGACGVDGRAEHVRRGARHARLRRCWRPH
jgi:hypothetical protein